MKVDDDSTDVKSDHLVSKVFFFLIMLDLSLDVLFKGSGCNSIQVLVLCLGMQSSIEQIGMQLFPL